MLTHLFPWQNVPSAQGVALLLQGALMPWHSLAAHDDISVEIFIGDMNPSVQKPPEHVCPIGHVPFAKQGSLAEPPFQFRMTFGFDGDRNFIKMKATKTTNNTSPNPELRFEAIPSVDVSENSD